MAKSIRGKRKDVFMEKELKMQLRMFFLESNEKKHGRNRQTHNGLRNYFLIFF